MAESGSHEILKDEQGLYTVLPKEYNRTQPIMVEENPTKIRKTQEQSEIEYIPPVDAAPPAKNTRTRKMGTFDR